MYLIVTLASNINKNHEIIRNVNTEQTFDDIIIAL